MARILVHEPVEVFRRGLVALLADAGFDASAPAEIEESARQPTVDAALVGVHGPDELALVARIRRARADLPVIAVVATPDPADYAAAIRAGAFAAAARKSDAVRLVATTRAALGGCAALPLEVARRLADAPLAAQVTLEETQVRWLRELARGATVATLARTSGYSERSFYRLLGALYERLGVRNRNEAIVAAAKQGLV